VVLVSVSKVQVQVHTPQHHIVITIHIRRVLKALLDRLALLDLKALPVLPDLLVPLVLQVLQVMQEVLVPLVQTVPLALLVTQEHPELQDLKVLLAHKVKKVPLAQLVLQVK